jgi:acyl-[acyl-carrier-protein]-phospholipid O-acyltransferase/long-chain-fatty-acid--[acyl-carrier-protein] ligase
MGACAIDLYLGARGYVRTAELAGIATFLRQPGSWRIVTDLVGLAMGGGLFTVPLYAILQHESQASHLARVIAANNIINALAMTVAALVSATLLSRGLTMAALFGWCGVATIPVVVMAAWMVRRDLTKSLVRVVLRVLYRVEVEGLETSGLRCRVR